MYILEKLIRLYSKFFIKKSKVYRPVIDGETEELEDVVTCKHNFMPIDSTGNILACSKCGYLITKDRLKKKKS